MPGDSRTAVSDCQRWCSQNRPANKRTLFYHFRCKLLHTAEQKTASLVACENCKKHWYPGFILGRVVRVKNENGLAFMHKQKWPRVGLRVLNAKECRASSSVRPTADIPTPAWANPLATEKNNRRHSLFDSYR